MSRRCAGCQAVSVVRPGQIGSRPTLSTGFQFLRAGKEWAPFLEGGELGGELF